jgi:hypothetical protein
MLLLSNAIANTGWATGQGDTHRARFKYRRAETKTTGPTTFYYLRKTVSLLALS